ncbi:glycosyltransferase [Paenibacillus illinoisensis]|uniref:Glycosyl transferase n=1 Tax=Paenibacillus illinoisensis TaxID=59845 RepID=A0A2W0D0Z4_9BACL|nr:glycosyltransferase [Paenibacillus illinoisensis]PYY29581.1 Glycosyl transferase [Paenibacillus illinoisensis]
MSIAVSLLDEVIQLIKEGNLERGYEICFKELMDKNHIKEADAGLALLSMVVGNHELADWYLSKSNELNQGTNVAEILLEINDSNIKKKWDNYRRLRNQQELKRMAVTAPLCRGDVLEIGCANGDLSIFIASHGSNLYGIDIDPVAIDLARHKTAQLGFDTCRFQVGNGYKLEFSSNTFDTVVVAEVLEHVDDPKKIISEAYRVCKPGGKVIFSVPNAYSIPDPDHSNIFTKEILNGLVDFTIGHDLEWVEEVPNEWIMGTLLKHNGHITHSPAINDDMFLPQPYTITKSEALVTVIIPTYNRIEFIAETIESVIQQSHTNLQIIVVDDGSVESPKDVLKPFMDNIQFLSKENGGKSSALNFAIGEAKGDFIWVFDDDDIALPLKLELQLKRFALNPKLGLVHTRSINFINGTGEINGLHDLSPYNGVLDYKLLIKGCFIHGPTAVFKRECLNEVVGWDEELIRAQDFDFWLRIAKHYEMEYLPVPTVKYRLHTGSRGSADNPVAYNEIVSATNDYEKLIYSKLYRTVQINEIYPMEFSSDEVAPMLEAFLDRAVIFAKKGLLNEVNLDVSIVRDNSISYGNPCFSAMGIRNIHNLANIAVKGNWSDQELVNNVLELLKMVTTKD